jgi:Domain of unknown function (DUF1818)
MGKVLKAGVGWRLGWRSEHPDDSRSSVTDYPGLVGADDWALEMTAAEMADFCRLVQQLSQTMAQMTNELMAEEKIDCEAESDLLWLQVSGEPHSYSLRLLLNSGRRAEGNWTMAAVPELVAATATLGLF